MRLFCDTRLYKGQGLRNYPRPEADYIYRDLDDNRIRQLLYCLNCKERISEDVMPVRIYLMLQQH